MVEAIRDFAAMEKKNAAEGGPRESQNTLNSFNYFCVFCLRLTLQDNKGNFAGCQECGI